MDKTTTPVPAPRVDKRVGPRPENRAVYAKVRKWLDKNRSEVAGIGIAATQRKVPFEIGIQALTQMMKEMGITGRRPGRLSQFNWALPDADLSEIWGIRLPTVRVFRVKNVMPKPTWYAVRARFDDPKYQKAVRVEREKARKASEPLET